MAITSSAKKAHRASLKKRVFNLRRKRSMRNEVKKLMGHVAAKEKREAQDLLPVVYKALDKATKRGVIKENTAARNKARLTAKVNAL